MTKHILDVCCGSKMFWFDRNHANVVYVDKRAESHTLCDGRELHVRPDIQADFRALPFSDALFHLVIFDPPHLTSLGETSWMAKKYGKLFTDWQDDIRQGFAECWRVLAPLGTLIFKWNETDIPLSKLTPLFPAHPLIGHLSGKGSKTHWLTFMKL